MRFVDFVKSGVSICCYVNGVIVGLSCRIINTPRRIYGRMDETKEQSFANDRHHEDAVKLEFTITAALQDLRQSSDDVSVNKHNATIRRAIDRLNNKLEVIIILSY